MLFSYETTKIRPILQIHAVFPIIQLPLVVNDDVARITPMFIQFCQEKLIILLEWKIRRLSRPF